MTTIPVKEGSPVALPSVEVGRASVFRARVVGVPADLENVQIHIGAPTDASGTAVPCAAAPGGEWRVYASGLYFPATGRAQYRVTARTPQGDSVHLGTGTLFVVDSSLNVDEAAAPIVPEDTFLRNPATGRWHKFTCRIEDGEIVPELEKEGITK